MSISSLGVGSNVLTQDVIDQLKNADKAKFVQPLTTKISAEKSKSGKLDIVNALMDNLSESTGNVADAGLFNTRSATVSGSAVEVTAHGGSDIQNFDINVKELATKEIEQSGSFDTADSSIASGDGQLKLSVGSKDFLFDYTSDTSLTDLKDQINKDAKGTVQASIVEVAKDDFRLFLTSTDTGTDHDISITDVKGKGEHLDDQLKADTDDTDGYTNVQAAQDASFTYNGLDITRKSNSVTNLLAGVTITLKEKTGDNPVTHVNVTQDVKGIEEKLDSFVTKHNAAIRQLNTMTKSSKSAKDRGVFSNDATIKGMKNSVLTMTNATSGGVDRLENYGFTTHRDGTISLDHSSFEKKLKANPKNVAAFFVGGDFSKDGTTHKVSGVFNDMKSKVDGYTKSDATLDQLKTSYKTDLKSLEDQQKKATARLTAKYAIMKKRFAAYDAMISKFNSSSDFLTQLINQTTNG